MLKKKNINVEKKPLMFQFIRGLLATSYKIAGNEKKKSKIAKKNNSVNKRLPYKFHKPKLANPFQKTGHRSS